MRQWVAGVIAAALVAVPAPALASHSELAGHWPLDVIENDDGQFTPDLSGHGNTGHVYDVSPEPGRLGSAMRFNGDLSRVSTFPFDGNEFSALEPKRLTVSAWVKRAGAPGNLRYLVAKGASGCNAASYGLYTGGTLDASDGLRFYVYDGLTARISPVAGPQLWDGAWHAVAGTFDGSLVRLYVDGRQVGAGTAVPPGSAIAYGLGSGVDLTIGNWPKLNECGYDAHFPGAMDDVRIYNRALSATEIAAIHGGGGGSVPRVTAVTTVRPALVRRPAILDARVVGAAERLEWNLRGDGRPEVVSSGGQTGLRFRPRPGINTISVRAIGPDGQAGPPISQTVIGPPAPGRGLTARIARRVAKRPIDAAGPISSLAKTGPNVSTAACDVTTTMRSGALEVRGCLLPVESLSEIPRAERGIVEVLAKSLGIGTDTQSLETAIDLTDAYFARSAVRVNGVMLHPNDAAVVVYPQIDAIASSNATFTVGDLELGAQRNFVLPTSAKDGRIDVGRFPRMAAGRLTEIAGIELVGDVDVTLGHAGKPEALITASLKLPRFLKVGGVDLQSAVEMRANNRDGLIVDNLTIGPLDAQLGGLSVKQLRIDYKGANDEWRGQGKACVISGYCLDMIPPNGAVVIKNGGLDFAGASLPFPPPGIPLFSGVNLERIGFGFGLNPTRFTGNARFTFARILVIDGRMVIAFPSAATPFILNRGEVGNAFPAHLYTYRYTGLTIGVSAGAALRVPAVGEVPFANAYALYEYPGYLALGGGVNFAFPSSSLALISVNGRLDGEINAGNGRFNFDGHVEGCVVDVICQGVDGNLSSNGMAVCTKVDTFVHEFHMGGAIRWSPFSFIPYLDGCKWGRFREPNVRGARVAQAGGSYVVRVTRGAPSRMVMMQGDSGAPRVRVTGPGGQALESPAGSELVASADANIRIMRSDPGKFVAVGLADVPPGSYTIEPMAGSPAIASVKESSALPNARVRARVTGRGDRRTLSYSVGRRPNQSVSFWELDAGGGARQIGSTIAAGRGKLRFTPAPGRGTRRIEARFELDRIPAEQKVVAHFRAPSPKLGKPRRLRVRRTGNSSLRVSWQGVTGAARYELALTLSSGRQRFVTTHRRNVLVKRIPKWDAARVTVRAVDNVRQGPPAAKHVKRTAPKRTNLRPLKRCRVSKRRVVCH